MKTFCKVLCALIVFSFVLAGCSDTVEVFDLSYEEEIKGYDGATFYTQGMGDYVKSNCLGYSLDGIFGDIAQARWRQVEKDYDCHLENDTATNIGTSIAAGQTGLDILRGPTHALPGGGSGYLVGYSLVSDILDYTNTDVWGTKFVNTIMCYNNDLYGVQTYGVPQLCFGNYYGALALNVDLCKRFGIKDPREYLENGLWDYDHFRQSLIDMTIETGDKTIYGIKIHTPYYFDQFARTNGDDLVIRDANGEYICGYYTETAKVAFQTAQDLLYGETAYCFYPDESTSRSQFSTEDCIMAICEGADIYNNFVYNMEYVGTLPFPHGPAVENCNYACFCETFYGCLVMPVNCQDYEASATLINALYSPFAEYPDKEAIRGYIESQIFYDKIDADTMLRCMENTRSNFYFQGGRTLAEAISSKESIQATLDAYESRVNNALHDGGHIIENVRSADYMYEGRFSN